MKCLKCDGELHPILKDGKSYAQCDKCGALFTRHDLKNHAPQPQTQPQNHRPAPPPPEPDEDERRGMGKVAAVIGWTLCVSFLMFGLATGGASLVIFLIAALLINPIFRNRVYISGKIWIPLVIVLFIAGMVTAPTTDTEPKKVAKKQEAPATSVKKQAKASAEKQTKKAAKEKAEKEEQERITQEQTAAKAEQERIAQEQAAAQAEQERIAQEEAAAKAEQERIAQEQAAQQAEQERIAQEQAEQQRIAQEQTAAQTNTEQNPFNIYDNPGQQQTSSAYVLNTSTEVFHYPQCNDVKKIAPQNYSEFNGTRDEAINQGYRSCGHCNP